MNKEELVKAVAAVTEVECRKSCKRNADFEEVEE